MLGRVTGSSDARARAITTLGHIAYQPKPWDGHWWGTQPVKNPPPLPSVAWEGTAKAIEALTAALADADSGVRLAAAKACSQFREGEAPAEPKLPGNAEGKNGLGRSLALPSVLPALRARHSAETDPAIRRQVIESLGVQKDSQAMEVFHQIALDEKADADFRDTAINAVVNIGGDAAKKTIAQLASAKLSPTATRKIIKAAGELRVMEAAPALIAHLSDEDAGNREFAAKALARLGPKSGATDGLIAALLDRDAKVQTAAVEALGVFKDKRALPALLDFAKTARKSRELIAAIAAMPDAQALPFLVDALREKGGERRVALDALKKTRAESWPLIEQALAAGRIPAEYEPEIRAAFESGAIAKWKMIGPFENVWGAVHPPERDALAACAQVISDQKTVNGDSAAPITDHRSPITAVLSRRYTSAEGKETGWIDVTADADGHVNLAQVFHNDGMVCAYAFTEIESPAEADARLLCGSDDEIAVWLNGVKVHDSGVVSRSFGEDQDQAKLHFVAGRNALLVKIGNLGSAWEFAVRIPGLDGDTFKPSKELSPDEKQRAFALATKPDGSWFNAGDAKRGEKLFFDKEAALSGICATCHAVRGKGGAIGPDLSAIAVNYRRPELVVSILEPSKTIALGFEQSIVETKAGETLVGALRQETNDTLTLVGADGQPHVVKKADVKSRKPLELSLMPPGLTLALKPADFADLLAFLETLK
jgi:putative heme-binding domain-containing protein